MSEASSVPANVDLPAPDEVLTEESLHEIAEWVRRFPEDQMQSAVLGALHVAQHQNNGYLTPTLMDAVAAELHMPPIAVYEVASFYSMFELQPVGRHSVSICTNISCMLMGSDDIVAHVEKKCGVRLGSTTPDGRIFLKVEEECLAACAGGPMMQVDHVYHTQLTPEKVDRILDALE